MIGGLGRWGRVGSQTGSRTVVNSCRALQWMLELKLDFEHALLQA
jgi:hypothetical protein